MLHRCASILFVVLLSLCNAAFSFGSRPSFVARGPVVASRGKRVAATPPTREPPAPLRGGDTETASATKREKKFELTAAAGALAAVSLAAKLGYIPGLSDGASAFTPYTDVMIAQDAGAAVVTGVLAAIYVKIISTLAARGILDSKVSRKLIHTFAAPLFMLTWFIFSPAAGAKYFAAVVGFANMVRLYMASTGAKSESSLANAVSRTGDAKEALGGPFVYICVVTMSILTFWRNSLIGIVAISTMAAGDGMADLIGRRFGGNNKWFFSPDKSVAGTLGFITAATLCSVGVAAWLSFTGCLDLPLEMSELIPRIAAISTACAAVELLPLGDDNWTVPLSAAVLSLLFLYP